ncbi:hypothetical protein [Paraburkholderia sp. RL17-381-BIF-C]|uniref:hypothetical protein n=1 Tax=Paraburkholderia sp. RL17-381-BIF-C TaxID=3031635 RepID=UPI0038B73A89
MRVAGSVCALKHRVRHNAFPHDLLLPEGIEPKGFSWPPLCRLQFYSTWPGIARTTENPSFDLADALAWNIVGRDKKTVYMSLRTFSPDWQVWDDKTLTRVEGAIEYDLNFDGFKVAIERLSPRVFNHGRRRVAPPCSSEFMWKLTISVMR